MFFINHLGTEDLNFYESLGLGTFWGLSIFGFIKPVLLIVIVANSPHYSP